MLTKFGEHNNNSPNVSPNYSSFYSNFNIFLVMLKLDSHASSLLIPPHYVLLLLPPLSVVQMGKSLRLPPRG